MSAVSGSQSALTVVVIYPDLLGTYGDGGNGLVLARRAEWRGLEVNLIQAPSDRQLPRGDLYCLGGGEDGPQVRAATTLIADGTLLQAAADGAVVLGVCAGFQLLGQEFPDAADRPHAGLGLLDVTTRKGTDVRAVGELVAAVDEGAPRRPDGSPLPLLTGFENHGGVTTIGSGASPLARVITGVGNGGGDGTEGAWTDRVVGTYLHGPVLARNVALADLLLEWALVSRGETLPGVVLYDVEESALRADRLAGVGNLRSAWSGREHRRRR